MKIVFLSRNQNNIERGVENFVKELSARLSKKHSVDVFAGENADSIKNVLEGNYDVVIPINGRLQSLKASLGRLVKNYKVLISGHSGKGRDDIWNIVVVRPDIFVALTNSMAHWAKKWAMGVKIAKIGDGVDIEKFNPKGHRLEFDLERPIILSVGALTWYKHHEKVIEAVSKLEKGSLLIVGEGSEKERLEQLGQERLGKRFKIFHFSYDEMPDVYRSCDLFTLPSWDREAFGIVYLEALASGLGVVAPNDASRAEIVGEAGVLVNVDNITSYSEGLIEALGQDWKKKAQLQAEKFSWDKIAKDYEKVIVDLLETRR